MVVKALQTGVGYVKNYAPKISETTKERLSKGLKITLYVVSALALTIAIVASVINLGLISTGYPLSLLKKIGEFGSGVLLTASVMAVAMLIRNQINRCRSKTEEESIPPQTKVKKEVEETIQAPEQPKTENEEKEAPQKSWYQVW